MVVIIRPKCRPHRNSVALIPRLMVSSLHKTLPHGLRLSALATFAVAIVAPAPLSHANEGGWDLERYHVQINIATDVPGGLAEQLAADLPRYLSNRMESCLFPTWLCDVKIAAGTERPQVFADVAAPADLAPPKLPANKDKLLLATVRWTPDAMVLAAREFDRYVQRWSPTIHREVRQSDALSEQIFLLLSETLSPLAQFEPDAADSHRARLTPRGASLPQFPGAGLPAKPGDVYLPILRRTARNGEVEKNGIQIVPWTLIEIAEVKNNAVVGRFQSANRRPLSAKRQGRLELVAIALRADPATSVVRLRSRSAADKPLVGYEVYSQKPGDEALVRIGLSDVAGQVSIPPIKTPIQFLLIKHGGQLFARVPIVAGAQAQINVPLPDDDARLAAEARLAEVREDLIDVVARRNILISRVRQKIQKKDYKAIDDLLRALDDLPGRPQFSVTLDTAEQTLRSDDAAMQKRIKQLFDTTRTLLTQYLDLKPINQLKEDLREAQRKAGAKGT
jgi:hypothetical protein